MLTNNKSGRNALKQRRSFNLLELLMVVVIIGILAFLAMPGFQQAVEEARIKEAQSVLKAIRGAEKIYKAETGFYIAVDPAAAPAAKNTWWTALRIDKVADTPDWLYGVEYGCSCNSGGGWGGNSGNRAAIPYAQRIKGRNATNVMHIKMANGNIDALDSSSLCPDVNCADQY